MHHGVVLTTSQIAIVDTFGRLYNEKQAFAVKQLELDSLATIIRDWYPDLAADKTALAVGELYEVQVGQREIKKCWVSMQAVYKAAGGLKGFLKICSVTFKALSDSIGQPAAEALQTEARTGSRRLKAVARLSPVVELPKAA